MLWKKAIFLHQKTLQNFIPSKIRNICISKVLRKDYYEVLGVKRDATLAEIKNAYFELSKIYHPDRIAATDENLAKFREISNAYEILGNEHSRQLYDRGIFGDERSVEAEDASDPIIKFYKERQQRGRVQSFGSVEEDLDAWTQKYYKEARKASFSKTDIFQASKFKEEEFEDPIIGFFHIGIIWFFVAIGFCMHVEYHPLQIKYEQFKAWLNEK